MQTLNYFIKLDDGGFDQIKVEMTMTLCEVRDVIYGKQQYVFESHMLSPAQLELYKPSSNLNVDKEAVLFERIQIQDLSRLTIWNTVEQVFNNGLDTKLVHIVIVPRPTGKRSRASVENTFMRMKKTKIAAQPPSTTAQPQCYRSIQRDASERILDDRPSPDKDIPPISLLYDGYGHFLDICRGRTDVPGLDDVKQETLNACVDTFADDMCRIYENEGERREKGLRNVYDILCQRSRFYFPPAMPASIGDRRVATDGHVIGDHGGLAIVFKFENEPAGFEAIPKVELTGYVAHANAKSMAEHQDVFQGWRVPSLGLTIVGPDITFYAIIAIDHQYRVVPLTSTLSCIPSANDGDDRKTLYAAFTAASVLTAQILEDSTKFLKSPPPAIPSAFRRFPAVTKLPRYDAVGHVEFQIQSIYPEKQDYRFLYIAETKEKKEIIVKFTRRYSIELHALCAERGCAPSILGFASLPGGWYAVAMEYISSAVPIAFGSVPIDAEQQKQELRALVDFIHGKGFVHGDLRYPNIIFDDQNRLMLIDFDWGGKEGEVSYPTGNLNEELLRDRTATDLTITKDDDRRVLQITLEKL